MRFFFVFFYRIESELFQNVLSAAHGDGRIARGEAFKLDALPLVDGYGLEAVHEPGEIA